MRFHYTLLGLIIACGNPTEPQAPPPSTTSSAAPSASATAPLASASASAAPSASAVVEAPPPQLKPIKELLANAKTIKLVWQERIDTNQGNTIDIKTDSTVKGIIGAIGADQSPQGGVPGFMITFSFIFQDAAGAKVA